MVTNLDTAVAEANTPEISDEELEQKSQEDINEELIKKINQMVIDSNAQKEKLRPRWIRAINYYNGNQWIDRKLRFERGKKWNMSVSNEIKPVIDQKVSMLTDNNPIAQFVAQEDSDSQYAKDLQSLVLYRWRKLWMRQKVIKAAKCSAIFGFTAMKVFWNDEKNDVDTILLNPQNLIIDPTATSDLDVEFIGSERLVPLEYALTRWPEHAEELKKAVVQADSRDQTNIEELDAGYKELKFSEFDGTDLNYQNNTAESRTKYVKLCEIYWRDYTEVEYEIPVPMEILKADGYVKENLAAQDVYVDSGELFDPVERRFTTTTKEPAYPDGRITIKIDNTIIEDAPWEGLFPICIGVTDTKLYRWYGQDDISPLIERQNNINDMISNISDHTEKTIHPIRKIENGSVANLSEVRNHAGAIIKINQGRMAGLDWEAPPPLSKDVYDSLSLSQRNIENASGLSGPSMGKTPDTRRSATEIATLDRASRGRTGMASTLFDEFISKVFLIMGQVIQLRYPIDKVVRVLGENGTQRAVVITSQHKTLKFDSFIQPSSMLPFDKQKKKENMLQLYQIVGQAILPEVLESFDELDGKVEQVLERHSQWQMFSQLEPYLHHPVFQQHVQMAIQEIGQEQQQPGQLPPG